MKLTHDLRNIFEAAVQRRQFVFAELSEIRRQMADLLLLVLPHDFAALGADGDQNTAAVVGIGFAVDDPARD